MRSLFSAPLNMTGPVPSQYYFRVLENRPYPHTRMVSSIWYLFALSIEIGGLTVECILLSDESDAFAAPILLPAARPHRSMEHSSFISVINPFCRIRCKRGMEHRLNNLSWSYILPKVTEGNVALSQQVLMGHFPPVRSLCKYILGSVRQ